MNLNCPRCHTPLYNKNFQKLNPDISFSDIGVDECSKCSGIWFDKGELEQIHDNVEVTLIEIRKIPSKDTQNLKLNCPKCKNTIMDKVQNCRDSKVMMDVCPACQGTWLDGDELKAIQEENLILAFFNTVVWIWKNS